MKMNESEALLEALHTIETLKEIGVEEGILPVTKALMARIKETAGWAAKYIEHLERMYACLWHETLACAERADENRWVPVEERLPENERDVLACYGFKHDGEMDGMRFIQPLCYFRFDKEPHWQFEGANGLEVTHWMPMPKTPEEQKQEAIKAIQAWQARDDRPVTAKDWIHECCEKIRSMSDNDLAMYFGRLCEDRERMEKGDEDDGWDHSETAELGGSPGWEPGNL